MPTDQPATKGGNVILRRVDTPNRVSPGEGYEVAVKVSNGAAYINPMDPDSCGDSEPGYKLRVVLEGPDGQTYTRGPTCHLAALVATGDETYTFELEAPESQGEHEVSARVEMVGSGKATASETSRFLVDSEESESAGAPDGDSNDDLSQFGDADGDGYLNFHDPEPRNPDVPSGGGPLSLGGQLDKLLLVAGVLALAWAADSGAEVVS